MRVPENKLQSPNSYSPTSVRQHQSDLDRLHSFLFCTLFSNAGSWRTQRKTGGDELSNCVTVNHQHCSTHVWKREICSFFSWGTVINLSNCFLVFKVFSVRSKFLSYDVCFLFCPMKQWDSAPKARLIQCYHRKCHRIQRHVSLRLWCSTSYWLECSLQNNSNILSRWVMNSDNKKHISELLTVRPKLNPTRAHFQLLAWPDRTGDHSHLCHIDFTSNSKCQKEVPLWCTWCGLTCDQALNRNSGSVLAPVG